MVGLVTTTQVTHATPAAFATHVMNRHLMTDIAEQMMDAGVDVILGGGEDEFLPLNEPGCFPETGSGVSPFSPASEASCPKIRTSADPRSPYCALGRM